MTRASIFKTILLMTALLGSATALAAGKRIVASSNSLCDVERKVCMRGLIEYEKNTKIMEVSARVQRSSGKGRVFFDFVGLTPTNENVLHTLSADINGRITEIVDFRSGMPFSNRTEWRLLEIRFESRDR